jgi:hypothetical protein
MIALVALALSTLAHADSTCTDGFRRLTLRDDRPAIVLDGFELNGIPSGSEFLCAATESRGDTSFGAVRHVCAGHTGMTNVSLVMQATMIAGVPSIQLLNDLNFPVFSGACVRN